MPTVSVIPEMSAMLDDFAEGADHSFVNQSAVSESLTGHCARTQSAAGSTVASGPHA